MRGRRRPWQNRAAESWLYTTPHRYSGAKGNPYIRTRAGMMRLPLFDPDYINPGVAVTQTMVATHPTTELRRRLGYMNRPGLGDPGTPEEKQMIQQELKRRKGQ